MALQKSKRWTNANNMYQICMYLHMHTPLILCMLVFYFLLMTHLYGNLGDSGPPGETTLGDPGKDGRDGIPGLKGRQLIQKFSA